MGAFMVFKILKRIFSRLTICVIGIIFQVGYLMSIFWTLGTYYTYSYIIFEIVGIGLTLYIISSDMNPSYKIAWIIPILIFPVFGVMFFLFFGNSRAARISRRMNQFITRDRQTLLQNEDLY